MKEKKQFLLMFSLSNLNTFTANFLTFKHKNNFLSIFDLKNFYFFIFITKGLRRLSSCASSLTSTTKLDKTFLRQINFLLGFFYLHIKARVFTQIQQYLIFKKWPSLAMYNWLEEGEKIWVAAIGPTLASSSGGVFRPGEPN